MIEFFLILTLSIMAITIIFIVKIMYIHNKRQRQRRRQIERLLQDLENYKKCIEEIGIKNNPTILNDPRDFFELR